MPLTVNPGVHLTAGLLGPGPALGAGQLLAEDSSISDSESEEGADQGTSVPPWAGGLRPCVNAWPPPKPSDASFLVLPLR